MKIPEITVLVLAVGGNVSQGILKALQRSSLPCRVIGTDLNALQMGLYTVDTGCLLPHATDPAFMDRLIALCKQESVDLILSGCEPVLRFLAQAKEKVEEATGALCFVCSPEIWERCDDKLLTCQWLRDQGFAYPDFAASEDAAALARLVATYGYPLLGKPRIAGGAQGLILIENEEDLAYVSRKAAYIVEEYLGSDDQEYTAGCFCDEEGRLRGSIVMWRELYAGTTYRAVTGAYPEVRHEAERIAAALGCPGPCNIQLRMTERGPVCFEINPRFSGTTPIRAALGYNEAEAVIRHFLRKETLSPLPRIAEGVALRYWNEVYVDRACSDRLTEAGKISAASDQIHIEPYGMH